MKMTLHTFRPRRNCWASPLVPAISEAEYIEIEDAIRSCILKKSQCFTERRSTRNTLSSRSTSMYRKPLVLKVRHAINCQNIYEVEKAMRHGFAIIHIHPESLAVIHQASQIGRLIEVEGLGLYSCFIFLVTTPSLYFSLSLSSTENLLNTAKWLLPSSDIAKNPTSVLTRPVPHLLITLVGFTAALSTVAFATYFHAVANQSRWHRAVNYSFVHVSPFKVSLSNKRTSFRSSGHSFLIRNEIDVKPSIPSTDHFSKHNPVTRAKLRRFWFTPNILVLPVVAVMLYVAYTKRK